MMIEHVQKSFSPALFVLPLAAMGNGFPLEAGYSAPESISTESSATYIYWDPLNVNYRSFLEHFYSDLVSKQVEPEAVMLDAIDDKFEQLLCLAD